MSDQTMTENRNTRRRRCVRNSLAWLAVTLALASPAFAQSYTVAPTPFQTAFDNNGHIINNACVWTYVAGTTTPVFTYSDNAGTQNSNPIRSDSAGRFTAYLIAGSSYKFAYESSCTPPAHGSTLRTADNIAGVPASSASVDVTGTAGETISAGQCVYLSDGSGSKTVGQWYKCDAANDYSSSRPQAGIAPSAIVSAATGTIRLAGSVPGLSLSIGSIYYAGSAGALTATKPATGRALGVADSATSLIVTANPPQPFYSTDFFDDFRVSLTTATCVTTSDVTAATTLFLTPCTGNRITLFDANGNPTTYTTAEISIAVPASTSQMYDLFVFASSGVPTLELLAWTNDTTRATAITRTNGRWVKSGDPTRLYVASCRTTTVSGQTEDSLTKRYVSNAYNRVRRPLDRHEASVNWNYTTLTYRQANAAAANQVDVVVGIAETLLQLDLQAGVSNATGGVAVAVAFGEDSTSVNLAAGTVGVVHASANITLIRAFLSRYPAVGRHFYTWLETSAATGTTTWVSTGGFTGAQAGITGWIEG